MLRHVPPAYAATREYRRFCKRVWFLLSFHETSMLGFTEWMFLCKGVRLFVWAPTAPVLLMKNSHNHFGNRPLRWSFGLSALRKAKGAGHFFESNACLFKARL